MGSKITAVMQPYLFPYIGYFQLIYKSDIFVLYDNVQFIKGGWINRNNFVINGAKKTISIPLIGASSNKLIKDLKINHSLKDISKSLKSIDQNYHKAAHFNDIFPIIEKALLSHGSIADAARIAIEEILNYLKLKRRLISSSERFEDLMNLEREQRLIEMVHRLNSDHYLNMAGGAELYQASHFNRKGLALSFLFPRISEYKQINTNEFIPGLSMIDVLMNCSKDEVLNLLSQGEVVHK